MNQPLGQLDRALPGLTLVVHDALDTKAGRPLAEHDADPARPAFCPAWLARFATARGLRCYKPTGRTGRRDGRSPTPPKSANKIGESASDTPRVLAPTADVERHATPPLGARFRSSKAGNRSSACLTTPVIASQFHGVLPLPSMQACGFGAGWPSESKLRDSHPRRDGRLPGMASP
jgi:hypothetical protein